MLPDNFIQRLSGQKYIDADNLLKALELPSPVSIRLNPSKWNKIPVNEEHVQWCRNGFYLDTRPSFTLDPLFHSGCYYPQEASGMFLEEAFRQTAGNIENIRVLDLCGAPGGKSTHLSDLIGPDDLLVTNEVIRARAGILAETVTKWGSSNTLVTQSDPSAFGRLSGYFDIILTDAPCSGEGMFRNNIAISEWSAENAFHCAERQKRIIADIWPALKENGILIYSTCTFNPGENEENIKWLIESHEAETVMLNISEFSGITEIDYNGIYGYGFYPDRVRGEGFFISVIRKKGSQQNLKVRYQLKPEMKPSGLEIDVAESWTTFPEEKLLKWGDELLAVPCGMDDYLLLFRNLKIIKAGTKIFTLKNKDFLPSHELALSAKIKNDMFHHTDISLQKAIAYLRRDGFILPDAPKGWNVITYRDINLGYINNLGYRFNNYFPVEWRIRMDSKDPGAENIIRWKGDEGIVP